MILLREEKKLKIVLDNHKVHKTKLGEKIAEILNINLIFLPPYSPDLNPIEDVWRKIKNIISNDNFKKVNGLKKSFQRLGQNSDIFLIPQHIQINRFYFLTSIITISLFSRLLKK
ncbi:MAG: transposase [Methanobrevibacter sp.]|nr:transposase [Methanobrevibacter sp.]